MNWLIVILSGIIAAQLFPDPATQPQNVNAVNGWICAGIMTGVGLILGIRDKEFGGKFHVALLAGVAGGILYLLIQHWGRVEFP